MIRDVHPGSRFRILIIHPSRIPDPEVKQAPDPGSGSSTLRAEITLIHFWYADSGNIKRYQCYEWTWILDQPTRNARFTTSIFHNFSKIRIHLWSYLAVPGSREADRELARFVEGLRRHWVACTKVFLTDSNHTCHSFLFFPTYLEPARWMLWRCRHK
jgi:hypothetical protein